uniref:CMP/dCMP-type deaminase domain-containing protein n=1 Tax=viral metagenome TaxID=1070528 RepID=A0A6C0KVL8_9ZZZZ
MELDHEKYMNEACKLSELSVKRGTGPFGCVIVKKTTGEIFGKGHNMVTIKNDPSLHAEIVAISDACHNLKKFQLSDCVLYTSCEPCPMCLSAIYWARIDTVYYGNDKTDAASIGFDDKFIYDEMSKPVEERKLRMTQICQDVANVAFKEWSEKVDKIPY